MLIRQSDLDTMIAAGSTRAREPETAEDEIRERLGGALEDARTAVATGSDADLAAALERLQVTAGELAGRLRERDGLG